MAFSGLCCGGVTSGKVTVPAKKKTMAVPATADSNRAESNGPWGQRRAMVGRLWSGQLHSAAADWSRFPLGKKFQVVERGKVYLVDHEGLAIVGKERSPFCIPAKAASRAEVPASQSQARPQVALGAGSTLQTSLHRVVRQRRSFPDVSGGRPYLR